MNNLSSKTLLGLISSACCFSCTERQQADALYTNIVFILADDMGYGDLACYGNKYIQTPNYFPDMLPALATLAGAEIPSGIQGMNVLPLFVGEECETNNRMLYWEFPGKQRAARKGDWKAVTIHPDKPLELYNLRDDITESENLAGQYPDILSMLQEEMDRMSVESPNWPALY